MLRKKKKTKFRWREREIFSDPDAGIARIATLWDDSGLASRPAGSIYVAEEYTVSHEDKILGTTRTYRSAKDMLLAQA